jgi:pantetheine-phosphate adenylyltransferase
MGNKAIYPGSFDPITNGHVDIIRRGLKIFDRILVAVLENPKKDPLLTTKERVAMIRKIFKDQKKVEVKSFHGLLVEFEMALMNRKLSSEMETLYMMPSLEFSFLSSNLVKEVFMLGGSVRDLVPRPVETKLRERFGANKRVQNYKKAGKNAGYL